MQCKILSFDNEQCSEDAIEGTDFCINHSKIDIATEVNKLEYISKWVKEQEEKRYDLQKKILEIEKLKQEIRAKNKPLEKNPALWISMLALGLTFAKEGMELINSKKESANENEYLKIIISNIDKSDSKLRVSLASAFALSLQFPKPLNAKEVANQTLLSRYLLIEYKVILTRKDVYAFLKSSDYSPLTPFTINKYIKTFGKYYTYGEVICIFGLENKIRIPLKILDLYS